MHKALGASQSHAKQSERTKQNPGPDRSLAGGIGPTTKGKFQTTSQMGEAQWPKDTTSPAQLKQQFQSNESNQITSPVRQIDRWEVICKQVVHGQQGTSAQIQVPVPGKRVGKHHIGCQDPVQAELRVNV